MFAIGFPDAHCTVEEMTEEGHTAATRWTGKRTHRVKFRGIPPTAKRVVSSGITVRHIASGKIIESRLVFDVLRVLQRLGAIPARA
jgi:predicted ester cyclase